MKDFVIVGSGIGGSGIAALLNQQGHDIALLEKEPYLGGCASTFSKNGHRYNSGATTFPGYGEGHVIKTLFDDVGVQPQLIETDPTLTVLQQGHQIPRYRDIDRFVDALNALHYHPENHRFWHLVATICRDFYSFNGYYYSDASLWKKGVSLTSYTPMLWRFRNYLMVDAQRFMNDFFGGISADYLAFFNAQLMIVAQATADRVNFLTAALALGYTFEPTHYPVGGMGALFDLLTSNIDDLRTKSEVLNIQRYDDRFVLNTRRETLETKQLILNTTLYDSAHLFEDDALHRYYQKHAHLNTFQSAFVLYLTLRSDRSFEHHYQIIFETAVPYTQSSALFVSFSDAEDDAMAAPGYYSVTASIHTDLRWWSPQNRKTYDAQKAQLEQHFTDLICTHLDIPKEAIVTAFSATPATFENYIKRPQLGGTAMTQENLLFRLPSNDTPFQGLYHVGDSSYAAQGWPGVVMGVYNLAKLLRL